MEYTQVRSPPPKPVDRFAIGGRPHIGNPLQNKKEKESRRGRWVNENTERAFLYRRCDKLRLPSLPWHTGHGLESVDAKKKKKRELTVSLAAPLRGRCLLRSKAWNSVPKTEKLAKEVQGVGSITSFSRRINEERWQLLRPTTSRVGMERLFIHGIMGFEKRIFPDSCPMI
ncbi:hypothetical protein B296_00030439 [Ensete ventricosum]|uniref:Uncharacterized protein n=1 Tax=Ensete ventricosum TaxID=4639 RepID=A0A426X615_ENSVE|nr:hypothetical protein B296_00030439 [Ensete ventricosum]